MTRYCIGKTTAVIGDSVEVLLDDFKEEPQGSSGVPSDMLVSLDSGEESQDLPVGQPGSFIEVELPSGGLVCIVSGSHVKDNKMRILEAVAIGEVNKEGIFDKGSDELPTVGASVFVITPEKIEEIYQHFAHGDFSIGKLSLVQDQDAKIDLDSFLGKHIAILGQTGSGKSWTTASVLQKVIQLPKSSALLFDLHGEYKSAFHENIATYIDASEIELPYWLMNFEELVDLCVDRTEPEAPNQIAKFRTLIQEAKDFYQEKEKLGIPKVTVDTPVYFNFDYLIEQFEKLDTEIIRGSTSSKAGYQQGPYYGQFTKMIMRIRSLLSDKRFDFIFHPKKYNTSASLEDLFRKLLGEEDTYKKLVTLDLSSVPFDVRPSAISLILRCLFDFGYWYKRETNKPYPISVFCDEAHTYLSDKEESHRPSRLSAERIAKEGRKYGVSICVISQRPREVSSTILSQCDSFLCLRITNPDDQNYVRELLPDSMKNIVSIFSTLRKGEGLLTGGSVLMPTRIKVDMPDPKPDSRDISFIEEWSQEHIQIDFKKVLDAWRKQGVNSTDESKI